MFTSLVPTCSLSHQFWHWQTSKLLAHYTCHKTLCPCKLLYRLLIISLPSKTKLLILNKSDLSTKCTILTLNKGLKLHIPVITSQKAVTMYIIAFCDVPSHSSVEMYQYSYQTTLYHIPEGSNYVYYCILRCTITQFSRNVPMFLPNYTVPHPRRQ